MHFVTALGPGPGINIQNEDAIMTLASGLTAARGDLLAVNQTAVDSSLRFYEVRAPVTADFVSATTAANAQPMMCIALEDQTTAAGNLRCRFVGEVDALIEDTSLAIGAKLSPKNASRALDTHATAAGTGTRAVAILLEATTAANQIKRVMFDGVSVGGIGTMITNAS